MDPHGKPAPRGDSHPRSGSPWGWVGCLLIIWIYVGARVPGVNEVHYLSKAKHYWDPSWCGRDLFLQSADVHLGFYWGLGWVTRWCSLDVTAWIGRGLSWGLMCLAWYRLCAVLDCRWPMLGFALLTVLVDQFHLAGEWFLGGIEGKSIAYPLVFLGWAHLLSGQWNPAILCLAGAIFFHPVVGGWSLLLLTGVHGTRSMAGRVVHHLQLSAVTLGLALVIALLPIVCSEVQPHRRDIRQSQTSQVGTQATATEFARDVGEDADGPSESIVSEAAALDGRVIHVYERLPHHLVPRSMSLDRHLRFWLLVTAWSIIWWFHRGNSRFDFVQQVVCGSLLLTFLGLLIDFLSGSHSAWGAWWLQFYWFRLSDILVPLGVTLGLLSWIGSRSDRVSDWAWAGLLVAVAWYLGQHWLHRRADIRPPADRQGDFALGGTLADRERRYRDWRELCDWIRETTDPASLLVSPLQSQTLKWYAQRAEFVTSKDCPQDPESILEWWQRKKLIESLNLYRSGPRTDDRDLSRLAEKHGWDYIISLRELDPVPRGLPLVFRNPTFELYRLP